MLVYRLTLPTYVDPMALRAMNTMAPDTLYGTRMVMNALGRSSSQPAMRWLNAGRGWEASEGPRRVQFWGDFEWSKIGAGASPRTGLDAHVLATTLGLDVPLGSMLRVGLTGGYRKVDGRLAYNAPLDAKAWTIGGYAAIETGAGFYAQGSGAWLGDVEFNRMGRVSAYGQSATGRANGQGWAASGEAGWRLGVGRFSVTPFAAIDYADLKLEGYMESGASVSNLVYADRGFSQLTASVGGELGLQIGAIRPAIRGGYSIEREHGDRSAAVRLAGAQHAMGSVVLRLDDTERDSGFGELRIAMREGPLSGYVSGRGRWGRGDDDARASIGLGYAF